jgi:DNA-binding SARP family transcriptional activator/tetratricopeptide (TPR) repeat protein/DNA-binding XRE family transcriptional regulator
MAPSRTNLRLTASLLRDHRRAAGLTQHALASRAGVSVGLIRDLEQGRTRRPRPAALAALAGALGLSKAQAAELDGDGITRGLRLQVLGPLTASRDGVAIPLGGPAQRAVLGLLALAQGSLVHRTTIIDVLWPDGPPAGAVNLVQAHVSRLRRTLEPVPPPGQHGGLLACVGTSYRFQARLGELDRLAFDQLVASARAASPAASPNLACDLYGQAIELWRGEPLADVDLLRGYPAVVGLARQRAEVTIEYASAAFAAGRPRLVLALLRDLAGREPLNEQAHAQLMIALAGTGQQAEALAVYRTVSRRLDEELGMPPGHELADSYHSVLRQEVRVSGSAAAVASGTKTGTAGAKPAPAAVTPRQLPGAPEHFVGRAAELAALTRMLHQCESGAPGTVVISAIGGTAGVGKTTLAVHWAHQVAHRFADGQLYVNLRGFDPSGIPTTPADAVRGFLGALGVPADRVPAGLEAQSGLYRSLLADKRMLIVLDNAQDEQQVRPLLPAGSGSLVIVTSRNELAGLAASDGARLLTVDLLSQADARKMLAVRLGFDRAAQEPAAVSEIAELCARLPLALAVAAARATVRRRFPLADLAAELREHPGRLDVLDVGDPAASVRAVLSWSYRQLGPDGAKMFRLLGLHPGPDSTARAAASLAGIGLVSARRQLRELVTANLVTEHTPGRYALHDLLRDYALEQATIDCDDGFRRAAVARILDHYLHTANAAAVLLNPMRRPIASAVRGTSVAPEPLADEQQALTWFETEHQVLIAVVALAARDGYDAWAWQLPLAMTDFLDRLGQWREFDAIHRVALAAAVRCRDKAAEAAIRRLLANSCARLGDYEQAQQHLAECLELFQELGDQSGVGRVHVSLSWLAEHQGCYDDALGHDERAVRVFAAIGDKSHQAAALNALGWHHTRLGRPERARIFCRQALALNRELGIRHGQAATWDSLGYAEHQLGNFGEAAVCYGSALDILMDIGDRFNQAGVLSRLGDSRCAAGDTSGGEDAWRQALDIFEDLHHPDAAELRAKLKITTDRSVPDSCRQPTRV